MKRQKRMVISRMLSVIVFAAAFLVSSEQACNVVRASSEVKKDYIFSINNWKYDGMYSESSSDYDIRVYTSGDQYYTESDFENKKASYMGTPDYTKYMAKLDAASTLYAENFVTRSGYVRATYDINKYNTSLVKFYDYSIEHASLAKTIATFENINAYSMSPAFCVNDEGGLKYINAENALTTSDLIGIPAKYIFQEWSVEDVGSNTESIVESVTNVPVGGVYYDYKIATYTYKANYGYSKKIQVIIDLAINSIPQNYGSKWEVPSEINTEAYGVLEVVGIDGFASSNASGNEQITEVVIPETVKYINDKAFASCTNLSSVEFAKPENVLYLGYRAFYGTALKSLDLTGLLRQKDSFNVIQPEAFSNCNKLEKVTYTSSVEEISDSVYIPRALFRSCTNLSNFEFPQDTKALYIGDYAFNGCAFKDLCFEKDTYIGENAFEANILLENVRFNGNATLEKNAFLNSFSKAGIETTGRTVTFTKSAELGFYAFKSCDYLSVVNFNGEKKSNYTHVPSATPVPTTIATNTNTSMSDSEEETAEYETTLFKGCFSGTAVTSIQISTDCINLHNECFENMGLSELKIGGTKLIIYGGLFNHKDKLTNVEISSTSVHFCSDNTDYCKYEASDYNCEISDGKNEDCSIYTGSFTRSNTTDLIFTSKVELISGLYRGVKNNCACHTNSTDYDGIQRIYLFNPTLRIAVSDREDYCGFSHAWHFVPKDGNNLIIYGYKYPDEFYNINYVDNSLADYYSKVTYNGYGEKVTSGTVGIYNNTEKPKDNVTAFTASLKLGADAFAEYCNQCTVNQAHTENGQEFKNRFVFCSIQSGLSGSYDEKTVVQGTKFDPNKLNVSQSYIYTDNRYNEESIECQGMYTGSNVGSSGFTYTASNLDSDGNFTSKPCTVKIYRGTENFSFVINPEKRSSESFEVEIPELVEGMTLSKADFAIKNLKYNYSDEVIADAGTAESLGAKIVICDEKGEPLTDFIFEEEASEIEGLEATKLEKGTYLFSVEILNHAEGVMINNNKNIVVAAKKFSKLEVAKIDVDSIVYENDAVKNSDFEVKVFYNNGNENDYVTLTENDYVIDKEKYSAGTNVLKFTYKNDSNVTGEIEVPDVVAEKVVSMSSNIDVAYSTMPEGSDIPWEHLGLIVTYNSERTHVLTSEEIKEHCTTTADSTIVAGKTCDFDIYYDGVESGIKATVKIIGTQKKLSALSVVLRSEAGDELSASAPVKVFCIGDTITTDDLFVIAYYNNGKDKIIDYKNVVLTDVKLTGTENIVKVSLKEDASVATEIKVTAKEPELIGEGISVMYNGPETIEEGHKVTDSDIVVVAHYENGDVILKNGEYTIEQYIIQNQVETEIKIWYKGFMASFKVLGIPATKTPTVGPWDPKVTGTPGITTTPTPKPTEGVMVTPVPTTSEEPTPTPKPNVTDKSDKKATPTPGKKQTFTWKSSNKSIKLVKTSAKTTYKIYTNKTIKLTPSVTDGDVYYQIVKSGKKVGKTWKKVNKQITIKSNTKACVYIKYTLNGKTVTQKTKGFILDKKAPKISVSNSGKLKVTDKESGIKSIKDGKKKVKNGTILKKGVHKIVAVDKAGNKKTMKVTIK